MEIRDWVTIVSVIAIIVGWFINSWLNRRNEIAKERLKYRMDTLQSIITLLSELQESSLVKKGDISHLNRLIRDTLTKFYIYGEKDEIELCKFLRKAINDKNNIEFENSLNKLTELVKNRIRQELQLSKL